jgi:Tfp pilus assembly protein PilV
MFHIPAISLQQETNKQTKNKQTQHNTTQQTQHNTTRTSINCLQTADGAATVWFCLHNRPRRCCDLRPTYCGLKTWNAVPKKYVYLCGISVSACTDIITRQHFRRTNIYKDICPQTPRYPIPFRRSQFRPLVLPISVFKRR